jgi:glycosyltransferase involved in cell wall biosynthesis
MNILLLSAYNTDSHKSWCQGLMQHLPHVNWTYLSLPGRYFSWRIRGNPLSWALGPDANKLHKDIDLIIATSMVDLATLKGLVPKLSQTPAIMYFHENQFSYPKSQQQHASIEPQMVNLYSAISAQKVLFNSQYNLDSFISGANALLKKLPDQVPNGVMEAIEKKSAVLPVPIQSPQQNLASSKQSQNTLKVIWNHRWEYDKGPELLYEVIALAHKKKLPLQFIVAGLSFRQVPAALKAIQDKGFSNVLHIGTFKEKADYINALQSSHVVLSTAIHEFQGLAMLEGAAHGCVPLAPNRLAYPEWVNQSCLYKDSRDIKEQAEEIVKTLQHWQENKLPEKIDVSGYYWKNLIQHYQNHLGLKN